MRTENRGEAPRAIDDFDAFLRGLRPSTRRLYLTGAKALLRAAFPGPAGPPPASYAELWARLRDVTLPKPARARPFLRFLESRQDPAPPEDLEPILRWVIEALDKANRLQKNPSLTGRRDAALVAALCAAPSKGNPRAWPKGCLAIRDGRVILWEREVQQEPAPAFALRFWGHWRERLILPDPRRRTVKARRGPDPGGRFPGRGAGGSIHLHAAFGPRKFGRGTLERRA